jgi:hypothetical protein
MAVVLEQGLVVGYYQAMAMSDDGFESMSFDGGAAKGALPASGSPSSVTRSVTTGFPSHVVVGEIALLSVQLTPDVLAGSLTLDVAVGAELEVRVEALARFEVVGVSELSLFVRQDAKEPRLQFRLKATEVGVGMVRVYVGQAGQALGSLRLQAEVVASAAHLPAGGAVEVPAPYQAPAVPVLVPDLCLTIAKEWEQGKDYLSFQLKTREGYGGPQVEQSFERVPLEGDPKEHFRQFFQDFEAQPLASAEWYLGWKGSELFVSLFPEKLRSALWSLRDRIYSLQIQSSDPWIPCELCRLQGQEDGKVTEGPFLCEAFAVTRWLPQFAAKPALKLRRIALVVPQDSKLKAADAERSYLLSLGNGARKVERIPATLPGVLQAMNSGEYDGWHFVGHGQRDPNKPDLSLLVLEKGQALQPGMLATASAQNLGLAQPLVFLNACQLGQSIGSLTGPAGWAEQFLEAAYDKDHPQNGAAAFIGAYWSIDSQSAAAFAQAFYGELLKGDGAKTVGEAVRSARLAVRKDGDPTWLAYMAFAHPLAKVE